MTSQETVTEFHRLFYQSWLQTWANTNWLGVPVEKPAHDLWIYQELMTRLRPDLIIETGTRFGGSALYLATVCDALEHGQVVTMDIEALASSRQCRPAHPRITYLTGSSTSPKVVDEVRRLAAGAEVVMVILDSDHGMNHVSDELHIYADLVTEGSYLIAEDTQFNGHPIEDGGGPGPWEAVEVFLKGAPEFAPDLACEKFLITFSPRGFLKRSAAESPAARLLLAEASLAERDAEAEELRSRASSAEAEVEKERRRAEAAAAAAEEERSRSEAAAAAADEAATAADQVSAALAAAQKDAAASAASVRRVEQSVSWKVTSPLRSLKRFFSGHTTV